jgi:hypothetical protein
MTASQINGVSFYAGKTAQSNTQIPLTYSPFNGGGWINGTNPFPITGVFNDDSTTPFYDGGNNYNTSGYYYTAPVAMNFAGKVKCDFDVRVNAPATTNNMVLPNGDYVFDLVMVVPFVGTFTASASGNPGYNTTQQLSIELNVPSVYLSAGDVVYVRFDNSPQPFTNSIF